MIPMPDGYVEFIQALSARVGVPIDPDEAWAEANTRVVDLNDIPADDQDDAIVTLRMLCEMHDETHTRWKITPSDGGSYNYEKVV